MTRQQCPAPECRAFGGHHHPLCPLASDEWRLAKWPGYMATYQHRIELLQKALNRQRELAVLWHGKFCIVKEENNRLRMKVERLEKEAQ